MKKYPKLQVWRPNNIMLIGRVYNHCITFDERGLRISITDEVGVKVDIVCDESSQIIGDYVWSYRFTNEIVESDSLVDLIQEAHHNKKTSPVNRIDFYKIINSGYLDSIEKTGWIGEMVELEHHMYPVSDGSLEVISDYEPKIHVENSSKHK
ncbi:hypothetical protein SAMN05216389_11674 [Oceanobacillus limi]|uniref:Uncharacterized protein n=1 Tax=Oceanobacillus limi TaxID=930131 RepID=A0A1I0FP23_9BACI|nr:hypothetical protein [Oceanobacillus limi]SET60122.1 hypothetical protein SAMN05216389_11674 [Oceanobacillus limi]